MLKYLKQYKFRDMLEMFKNEKADPDICSDRCDGLLVVITGATAGIGLEAAKIYAKNGADLILINRSREKSERLARELKTSYNIDVKYLIADFSSLDEVKTVTNELLEWVKLPDIFIHNAGIFHTEYGETRDGIEEVFQVNHLASFLMIDLLKERYRELGCGRLIYVNSEGHRFALSGVHMDDLKWKRHRYSGLKSYGAAKTAQLLTMMKFHDYFRGSGVTINAMHPGNVSTQIGDDNNEKYLKFKRKRITPNARDPKISGEALYYLGVSRNLEGISGKFFSLTREERPAPHALDRSRVDEVYNKSLELVGL